MEKEDFSEHGPACDGHGCCGALLVLGRTSGMGAEGIVPAQVERVALLPIFKGVLTYNVQESLTCAVCRLVEDADSNVPDADRILTELVQKSLDRRFGYAAIHPVQGEMGP